MPWLACAILALIGIPSYALGKEKRAAPPPMTATMGAFDTGFWDVTKAKDDPTATTVTIAPGGTVNFRYLAADGALPHNVVFGDGSNPSLSLPQPTGCTQINPVPTIPTSILPIPPLPQYAQAPAWNGTCTFNTAGAYKFYCSAHPLAMQGEVIVSATGANANPTVTAGRTPTGDVPSGTPVTFSATGADADGDTISYSWDFGDGDSGAGASATHTYPPAASTYQAVVTADDGHGGTATATVSVKIVAAAPNQNPTVSASRTPTGNVTAGASVNFSATGSDPDGDTLTYAWDFGDTGSSASQNISHTYAAAGAYTAKVTVSDGKGGTASATLPITVTSGSCPPGYRDDFTGTALDPSWTVLRPDATNGGVTVGNGVVSIPTGNGDIYQTTNTATNLVLRTAPSGAFTLTAKINHHGLTRYQQGGIIVYGDDDNYVKLDRTATNNGGTATEFFEFVQELAGTPRNGTTDHTATIPAAFPADFYLRIVWDGTNLSGAYSQDGSSWTTVGTNSTAFPANPKVGIFALSNGATTFVTPTFDYVAIDGPPCGSNAVPVISSATADKTSGIAPLPVNLTAAATDADSDALTYAWDFGDGATGTGATASHTYSAAGTYSAKLTVSDGKGGSATKTVAVNVLAPDTPGSSFRALVFSKTAVFRHDSIPAGIAAIKSLGTTSNFQVDATEDGSMFRDDILSHYKVVIFLSTTGDVLTDDQQAAFERYVRAGGGYVGIHSAADTEYKWAWYGQLVGAYFRNHPNGTPAANVLVEDTTDPSDAGLPATWARTDEWYNYQSPVNPVENGGGDDYDPRNTTGIHVLLKVDESSYAEADGSDGVDDDHPISWCHRYDGGRSWYTGMGHTQASFQEAGFLSHILAGIRIAAGVLPSAACGVSAVNRNPTVTTSRTPSGSVTTGTSIAFTAVGTDADGDALTYAWDFGDTGTATGQSPTHAYAAAGVYDAKVTVSDGKGGTGSATLTITVTGPVETHTDVPKDVTATVANKIALSLAPTATFGPITPGVTKDYVATVTGTVTSTSGAAQLTVADAGTKSTGHLVNDQYALAAPLQAQATSPVQPSSAFAAVTGTDNPLVLLTYHDPVSMDAVSVGLQQTVSGSELLRAGTYHKTLTFTLSTTTP
ncbi:PKD domain-containing protein [Candidatus Solirubrobacter pratensis]|uniref:PKD domain-containing protein n=1 Tax=Candidatus Solirubrobacter pratensis TaxID=1298857 RepID=UPI0004096813|nr:PKD domain-containing protein [Candidatus Solirubrobacter pratensis]